MVAATGTPPGVITAVDAHRPDTAITEALRLGAALRDVQDALGRADPRTTRRCDRSPDHLLATALTDGRP